MPTPRLTQQYQTTTSPVQPSSLQLLGSQERCSVDASALSFCVILPLQLPHSARFSQQLLDMTHRWWTEREDPDIDINYIHIKLHSARYPDPAPFQLDQPSHGYCCSSRQGVSQLRAWNIHTGGMGATLRVTLLIEDSASSTALSAGDSLTSLARPFWCTGTWGQVSTSGPAPSLWNPG